MESNRDPDQMIDREEKMSKSLRKTLLLVNGIMLGLGNCGAPLLSRLYFLKGGKKVWLSCALETGGWPFILLPLFCSYLYRRTKNGSRTRLCYIKPRLFAASAVLGILTGLDDYLYAYGVGRLPVSTSALIIATQLAFTAGFAFLLVKQKFNSFTINAIFLLSIGAVILGVHASSDRPAHESNRQYFFGFFMTLGASALYGFVLPAIELTYKKAKQNITYTLAIRREAEEFELGKTKYYVVLVASALLWQFFFIGAVGVISCASSLLSGIIIAVLLPVTETLAVLFYHEKFQVEKGISLVLCLSGFISYFYGEIQQKKKKKKKAPVLEVLV